MSRGKKKPVFNAQRPRIEVEVDEELDLHGMSVDEALAAVEQLLERHQKRPGSRLRVVHGHSNSSPESIRRRVRLALDTIWKKKVRRYRIDFQNPGATLIEVSGL